MVLKTDSILKYGGLITAFKQKNSEISDTLCLDLANGMIYLQNSFATARVRIDTELADYAGYQPVFLDTAKFLHALKEYEEVDITENYKLKAGQNGRDSVGLQYFEDPVRYQSLTEGDVFLANHEWPEHAELTDDLRVQIKIARQFVSKDETMAKAHAVFLEDSHLFGVDTGFVYEAPVQTIASIQIHEKAIGFLNTLEGGAQLYYDPAIGKLRVVSEDGAAELVISNLSELETPRIRSEQFQKSYAHASNATLRKTEFTRAVEFVEPYVAGEANNQIYIRFESDALVIESRGFADVVKTVPVEYITPELEGVTILLNSSRLKLAAKNVPGDVIVLRVDPAAVAVDIAPMDVVGAHVVLARLKDE